jgi:signal transduction histidine kinase/CheY-like chemotaxis protein
VSTLEDIAPRGVNAGEFLAGDSEMAGLTRAFDWSSTSLGPMSGWPRSLRTLLHMLVASPHPMFLWWGPDLIQFYNDGYRPSLADRHPRALGARGPEFWDDIWSIIGPDIEAVMQRGESVWHTDRLVPIIRNGRLQEVYWTYSYSPVLDDDGRTGGTLVTVQETTPRVLTERRMSMLRRLAEHTAAEARTVADVVRVAAEVLRENDADIAFALPYLLDGSTLRLPSHGSGMPSGAAPESIDLTEAEPDEGGWPLAEVARSGRAVLLTDLSHMAALPGGCWPEPADGAMVMPIGGQGELDGVLIAGLSPRLSLDEHYRNFLDLLANHLAAAINNARSHEAERARAEALAELDRAKTAFFANVSHEFRTPLTLMLGLLEDLLARPPTALAPEDREALTVMHRNGRRLLKLVNTLLDFSRIEAGRARAAYEATDIATYTAELASVFRAAIERAGIRLTVACPPINEPVFVDRDMWEKVVLNLLSNAFKYTFDGEIAVTVGVDDGHAVLMVRDTGIGIPDDEIPNLFNRFHRVEGARGRTQEGTGIGLAMVQELVQLHGGSVTVESVLNEGSTFRVAIPLGTAHLPADRIDAERTAPASVGAADFVEEALRWLPDPEAQAKLPDLSPVGSVTHPVRQDPNAVVLLADDNADMRAYLTRLLADDYEVIAVADGQEALRNAQERRPDIIISDVMMPQLDGFALLRALRADPVTSSIPLILLSARAGEEARIEGLKAGADDYLTKPFSAGEFLARVEAHLKLAAVRAEGVRLEAAARERLEAAMEQAPAALCLLTGPDHVFVLANPPYLELIGGRSVIGRPVREALPDAEGQGLFELLDGVYRTGEPYVGTEHHLELDRNGDGTRESLYVNFVYAPTRDQQGIIDGIFVHVYDVTQQVEARIAAEDATRARDQFLSIASHELRNPVTALKGTAQFLRRAQMSGRLTEERLHTLLSSLEASAIRLATLTNDLLDVATLQRGELPLRLAPTDLSALVREVVRHGEWGEAQLVLDAEPNLEVTIDPDRIHQVVSNLLDNAVKYSPPGEPIRVRVGTHGRGVLLEVQDSGIGLPPDALESIFTPFGRAANAEETDIPGMGLGLHVSRRIAEQHGGKLWAQSEGEGMGTLMSLWLPTEGAHSSEPRS